MSLRPDLQSIVGPDMAGAVVEGAVTALDPGAGTATLAVGAGTVQVALGDVAVGARVRLQLLARDVILATQPVEGLSVRNALASTVVEVAADGYGAVLVHCDVGGAIVLARITAAACAALGLRRGDAVWALVKAVSTRGHAFRMSAATG
ncbi:MAG: TOBE domain-containing protein [Gammaproteobacteria bacterium]|nr:TOBE domain-containing protein [Gammaproteobacteria bacterium]